MSQEIDVTATTPGPPSAVWALLDDSSSWPRWSPIDEHHPVKPPGADGLGEERRFRNGRVTVLERIVERRAQERLTYTLLSGLPLRDYRAEIDLSPEGGGTRVRWHTTFEPKLPGTGPLFRFALGKATQQFVDGLVRATTPGSLSMEVLGLAWLGVRTTEYEATTAFFRDVLGLAVHSTEPDFEILKVPDGATVEVFGPSSDWNRHLTHPVAGFQVADIDAAVAELEAAGVEIVQPPLGGEDRAWVHFRAPDGFVYELMGTR